MAVRISSIHKVQIAAATDWRCRACGSLLGRYHGDSLHVLFNRRHEYVVTLPASCTCRNCSRLNRLAAPG
jgi:rubredoxin